MVEASKEEVAHVVMARYPELKVYPPQTTISPL